MPSIRAIPRDQQRDEPWANGAGTTTVVLREPDTVDWSVRVSVACVASAGPFSELPGTRRILVPLDGPMTLVFQDGRRATAARLGLLAFAGAPAPTGMLPGGPTRDFNLMLRRNARAQAWARTLVGSLVLPHAGASRWLVYLANGQAQVRAADCATLALQAGDAALLAGTQTNDRHHAIRGGGDIVLARLYA